MGSIVGKEQMQILEEKVNLLKAETELIYDGKHDLVEVNYENGAFFTPKVSIMINLLKKIYLTNSKLLSSFYNNAYTKMQKKHLL